MFKQRKPKSFNYKPRFSKGNPEREVQEEDVSFAEKWRGASVNGKPKLKAGLSMRFLILALVLLLICMYFLEKKYM